MIARVQYDGHIIGKLFKGGEVCGGRRELALYISLTAPAPLSGVYALDVQGDWWSLRPHNGLWRATRIGRAPDRARLNSATDAALQRAAMRRLERL